ncbi:MAG: DNA-binding protein [candidate division Zixibacteria bacterium SM23_81]|nr:MAG: DNA-binding protein [candidate division Zixibacteria bacterium SM23_81]
MITIQREEEIIELHEKLPILPLRDVVIFPYMIFPLLVGRQISITALQEAMMLDRQILLCTQKNPTVEIPGKQDLYRVGIVARVLQILRLPNETIKILIEGLVRAKIRRFFSSKGYLQARIVPMSEKQMENDVETQALIRSALTQFTDYVKLNHRIPDEVLLSIGNIQNPFRLADTLSAHIIQSPEMKQKILQAENLPERFIEITKILAAEKQILEIEEKIDGQVRSQLEKGQREYYLQQQMKAIKAELGEEEETAESAEYARKIREAKMSPESEEKALAELKKLKKMHPTSPESTVVRNYLDWLISLPWQKRTQDKLNIPEAESILEEDHYGLKKPKERIVEHLAVMKLSNQVRGPILCFVGPPGVGKTSLGKSVARALGRNFVRISLGGVRDEAEIRGHRRTYIGSMPGKIIQCIKKAKTKNPVFLLDEVDKMSVDFRGDPSAALLEVLDPDQNNTFNDHYLEVDFDLSEVFFITTANTLPSIPLPLQDRMEIIRLPGYLEFEKLNIAKGFLIPKQLKQNGLDSKTLSFSDGALSAIVGQYTREAGVRNLEREIATICRKVAKEVVSKKIKKPVKITKNNLAAYLGAPRYLEWELESQDAVGSATGLAWTEVGGQILTVEVILLRGKGNLILTGKLGEVMKESGEAALSYARSRAKILGLQPDFYHKFDVHIHLPEGAIPKDGPSAGITIATALVSSLTGRPVRHDVAMTGELTLRGRILPVGGLSEKVIAAQRAGIRTVLLPRKNDKDVKELPAEVKRGLNIQLVENMDQVLESALTPAPSK